MSGWLITWAGKGLRTLVMAAPCSLVGLPRAPAGQPGLVAAGHDKHAPPIELNGLNGDQGPCITRLIERCSEGDFWVPSSSSRTATRQHRLTQRRRTICYAPVV